MALNSIFTLMCILSFVVFWFFFIRIIGQPLDKKMQTKWEDIFSELGHGCIPVGLGEYRDKDPNHVQWSVCTS